MKRQCEEKEQRLAVIEANLTATQKEVTDLRSCLREVERSRLEARRELQELRRQVRRQAPQGFCFFLPTCSPSLSNGVVCRPQLKVLDAEKEQKGREVAELQTRLALEEQREEEKGKEAFALKQKLAEAEVSREALKREVR